jgi:LacI family transcriptional regulator, gluconate utilization system Gnt-I transcriptional repressor
MTTAGEGMTGSDHAMAKPTLEEVAARAGVSKMTASRALRGAADVSPESLARVRSAAAELGYVRNQLALSLSAQRTNLVGVVVPSMSNIVFPEVVSGISAGLEGSPMQAVFGISDYDPAREHAVIANMLSWQPSAMIVTGLDQTAETRALLAGAGIPVVQLMDLDGEPVDFNVGLSHGDAGAAMARALLGAGRRRFAYVGSALDKDIRAAKRKAGFERMLAESGISLVAEAIAPDFSSISLGKTLTTSLIDARHGLDCIYYSNDDMAAGGLFALMEKGIDVPGSILPAGFNGLDFVAALPVHIATSRSPRRQIGRTAADVALKAIAGETSGTDRIYRFEPEVLL